MRRAILNLAVLCQTVLAFSFCAWRCDAQTPNAANEPLEALLKAAADSENWKSEILGYCRRAKEQIEMNHDDQLIRSSIAVSHFDLAMEAAANSGSLSQVVTDKLVTAAKSREVFESGGTPDFAGGVNMLRLKRYPGANISEFVLLLPPDYAAQRKWPVYVEIDPRRRLPYGQEKYVNTAGMINLWWQWPKELKPEWKDFQYFFELLKTKLTIDEDRIYMAGDCANGVAAMDVAFHHPDFWAECVVSVASSHRYMAGNVSNIPFVFFYSDVHEGIKPYYDFAAECFEYNGCSLFSRRTVDDIHAAHAAYIPLAVRLRKPECVKFSTDSLGAARAYWVEVKGRDDENFPAKMVARVEKQKVVVETDNINAYRLLLPLAPIDTNSTVEVVENGKSLGSAEQNVFEKRCDIYGRAELVKNANIHGPISDVFTDCFAVIWGSSGKRKHLEQRVANALAQGAPVFADVDASEQLAATHNIVLVGTPESNKWISRINERLPLKIVDGCVLADGRRYEGPDCGALIIYPNPLNQDRYTAVFAGLSEGALAALPKAYASMTDLRQADVGVFDVDEQGVVGWRICERLSSAWGWHESWKQVIAVTAKSYSRMKWLQLFGRAMRVGLKADAAICEDPFLYSDPVPQGEMTFRDLNNMIKNEWVVKVKVDGRTLKKVLTTAFTSLPQRQVKPLIVDGVSFSEAGDGEEGVIPMSSIADETHYTLALPEDLINGQRAGIAIENYEIVSDGHLALLVRDFFVANQASGIDALLENVEPRVF